MTIEVGCRQCGKRFSAQPHLAGQDVPCPGCGQTIEIPLALQPAADEVRCDFCHKYIPRQQYNQHVQQHVKTRSDGQQTDYATLPPEQRASSMNAGVVPKWYRHQKCGEVTGMPDEIIETYLTNPWFYLSDKTFCTGCGTHVRLKECVWEETGENLQAYNNRLRDAKPHLRPGLFTRALAWCMNLF